MFPTNFFSPYLKFEMQLFGYASEGKDGEECWERDRGLDVSPLVVKAFVVIGADQRAGWVVR